MQLPILEAWEKFDEFNLYLVQLKKYYFIASHEYVLKAKIKYFISNSLNKNKQK